jgi:hypothetical protein
MIIDKDSHVIKKKEKKKRFSQLGPSQLPKIVQKILQNISYTDVAIVVHSINDLKQLHPSNTYN